MQGSYQLKLNFLDSTIVCIFLEKHLPVSGRLPTHFCSKLTHYYTLMFEHKRQHCAKNPIFHNQCNEKSGLSIIVKD